MEKITTSKAPSAIGPYSQAIAAGDFLYTSGQLGLDPATGDFAEGGIQAQADQALRNLQAILEKANCTLEAIVKTTCYLQSMGDFVAFNEIYARYIHHAPARSCVEVAKLPKGGLVEIEAIAIR